MSQERDVQATQFANACQRRPIPLRVETGAKWPNTDLWIDNLINLFLILPFLITSYLPLTDLPNHLERQHILSDLTTSPALQNYYHYGWQLVPNLGIDLFVLAALFVVPIDLAVRVFCILGL